MGTMEGGRRKKKTKMLSLIRNLKMLLIKKKIKNEKINFNFRIVDTMKVLLFCKTK